MKIKSIFKKINIEEIGTCLLLILLGYIIAGLIMKNINGFSLGGEACIGNEKDKCKLSTTEVLCNSTYAKGDENAELDPNKLYQCIWNTNKTIPTCDYYKELENVKECNKEDIKYNCSGTKCIIDSTGKYNASNCDNKCGFSCNASDTCIVGLSGSGSYDTKEICESECESTSWIWYILIIGLIIVFCIV